MDKTPDSILIVGSGLFGLCTAWALTKRPRFDKTTITVVDNARGQFPPSDAASVDTSRIIRTDYSDPDYSVFGAEAQTHWRTYGDHEVGGQGRYSEVGIVITAATPDGPPKVGTKTGMYYARTSCENVSDIARISGTPEKVVELPGRKAIQEYLGTDGNAGDWGYVNMMSGWADNGAGMKWLYEKVEKTGRVNFVDAEVGELVTKGKRVTGAKLKDGRVLEADIVFVAAGAWTGGLIDLRGRCEATGHTLGYVGLTQEEQDKLEKHPVVLNFTTGLFFIPPRDRLLKVARHGFGYFNPKVVRKALPLSPEHERKPIVASLPWTLRDDGVEAFAPEAETDLRWALKNMLPIKGLEKRPWKKQRICWYSDTRDADWLVDWHPGWEGLFIATGDSGHGFKFLPILGDKLVDVLEGKGGNLGEKWRWKYVDDDGLGRETDGVFKGLITEDGSRGGALGMILADEFKKGGVALPKL